MKWEAGFSEVDCLPQKLRNIGLVMGMVRVEEVARMAASRSP